MKPASMSALALALLFMFTAGAAAQDLATQIVGVWKLVDLTRHEVATGKTDKPYGEKPTGYYIFTRGGHFLWTNAADGRKPPVGSAPTDAERNELFKTLSFGTGTYKVEGDKVTARYDSSWIQSWTGAERTFQPNISGTKMTTKGANFKHPITGVDVFTINTYEKIE
jgi:hypothetical protein